MGRVLVCGGRNYDNVPYLCGFLDCFHTTVGITHIIHGGASGTDFLAESWAKMHRITFTEFKAAWKEQGKSAGPIRNKRMLDQGMPDVVIAFPGGPGTANMVSYARSKNVPVITAGGRNGI